MTRGAGQGADSSERRGDGIDLGRPTRGVVFACFALGVALRGIAAGFRGLSHDAAAYYLPNARALAEGGLGNWDGMTIAVPPLFPTIVALLSNVVGDLEVAALTISVLAGASLVFPALGLARYFLPNNVPAHYFATLLAAVFPYSVNFGGDARADALYALLFAGALWAGLRGLDHPRISLGAFFGLLVGASYLLRPEALGVPLLFALGALVEFVRRRRSGNHRGYLRAAATEFALPAVLLLLPALAWNACFVHHKIGVWTLSPKAGALLDFDKSGSGDVFGRLNAAKTMTAHEERLATPTAYRRFALVDALLEDPRSMVASIARNLGRFLKYLPYILGFLPSALLMIGVWTYFGQGRAGGGWIVFVIIAFYACSFSVFYVSRRFWLPFIPLLLPWCGAGAATLSRVSFRGRSLGYLGGAIFVVLAVMPFALYSSDVGEGKWWVRPERILGQRLLNQFGPRQTYVSAKGKVTWYAKGIHLPLPTDSPVEDIAAYMRNRGARLLILDRARWQEHPERDWLNRLWQGLPRVFQEVDGVQAGETDLRVFTMREDSARP